MSRVLLGVTGGIAAYKACELLRRLRAEGHDVTVVPTAPRWSSSARRPGRRCPGDPVHTSVFDDAHEVPHVRLGQEADLVLVAPATADLLARAATGRADDLLTNVLLTARCPIVFAPAMHTEMWLHPATQANVATLRSRGAVVVDPDSGRLTGADSGPGRLPDPAELAAVATAVLADPGHRRPGGAARPGRARASRSAPAAPVSTSTRSGSSATARRAGWAGRWPGPRCCAGPRCTSSRPTSRCPRRRAPSSRPVVSTGDLADGHDDGGQERRPGGDGRRGRRLHPGQTQPDQDQEVGPGRRSARSIWCRPPTCWPPWSRPGPTPARSWSASPPRRRRAETSLLELGRAKLLRKGCDLLVLNDVGRGQGVRPGRQRDRVADRGRGDRSVRWAKDSLAHEIWDAALRAAVSAVSFRRAECRTQEKRQTACQEDCSRPSR